MNKNIAESIERLQKAGEKNSHVTKKLYEAAQSVASFIEDQVPAETMLPRGYLVREISTRVGTGKFLVMDYHEYDQEYGIDDNFVDGLGGYLYNDFDCYIAKPDRNTILKFAQDISTGFLDEIADWLEKRIAEEEEAIKILEKKF